MERLSVVGVAVCADVVKTSSANSPTLETLMDPSLVDQYAPERANPARER